MAAGGAPKGIGLYVAGGVGDAACDGDVWAGEAAEGAGAGAALLGEGCCGNAGVPKGLNGSNATAAALGAGMAGSGRCVGEVAAARVAAL